MSPKSPERLAEILQEILALSDSTRPSQTGSISDRIDKFDIRQVEEESQQKADEDNDGLG